jgi:predicted RNA-binding protein YlxR (DUF448 family)
MSPQPHPRSYKGAYRDRAERQAIIESGNGTGKPQEAKTREPYARMCIACRQKKPRASLLRITVDFKTHNVYLNQGSSSTHGRSCYLCPLQSCLTQALKGTRMKAALEGRKVKGAEKNRTINWPLEPQLIQVISSRCTEP